MLPMRDRIEARLVAHNNRGQLLTGRSQGYDTIVTCQANLAGSLSYKPCNKPMRFHRGEWHCPEHGEMT